MATQITKTDIVKDAKFKCDNGIVWVIDNIENSNNLTIVNTSMEHGKKGNYRDDIQTVVDFLNEEKAEKI